MLSSLYPVRFAASPATSQAQVRQGAAAVPNARSIATGDAVQFSGAAMDSLRQALQDIGPDKYYEKNRAAIEQLMQTELFPGLPGARVFKAFMEDVGENKDTDGDLEVKEFLNRLQIEDSALRQELEQFLKEAARLKLLKKYNGEGNYYQPTELGQYVLSILPESSPASRIL